jgi:hypothetical protein
MLVGDILRDLAMLTLIVFGTLAIFWFRSERRIHLRFWIRAGVLLLVCIEIGLIELKGRSCRPTDLAGVC